MHKSLGFKGIAADAICPERCIVYAVKPNSLAIAGTKKGDYESHLLITVL